MLFLMHHINGDVKKLEESRYETIRLRSRYAPFGWTLGLFFTTRCKWQCSNFDTAHYSSVQHKQFLLELEPGLRVLMTALVQILNSSKL
jgi:hypothetical protein